MAILFLCLFIYRITNSGVTALLSPSIVVASPFPFQVVEAVAVECLPRFRVPGPRLDPQEVQPWEAEHWSSSFLVRRHVLVLVHQGSTLPDPSMEVVLLRPY